MIHNYSKWRLIESLGDGKETFTQELELHGRSNLDIPYLPIEWGDDLESASGTLVYSAEIEVDKSGIEAVHFKIETIRLELEIRKYKDKDDDDGELIYKELEITKDMIDDLNNVKITVFDMPFYVERLEVDLKPAEDMDGEIDVKKIKYELDIGHVKN